MEQRMPVFKERFTQLRGNMTQAQFADFLGISRPTIGFYESGSRIPDAIGVRNIAEKCKVSADWLLGLSDVRSPDMDLQSACKYTGLSEKAIDVLRSSRQYYFFEFMSFDFASLVDGILVSDDLPKLMYFLNRASSENVWINAPSSTWEDQPIGTLIHGHQNWTWPQDLKNPHHEERTPMFFSPIPVEEARDFHINEALSITEQIYRSLIASANYLTNHSFDGAKSKEDTDRAPEE